MSFATSEKTSSWQRRESISPSLVSNWWMASSVFFSSFWRFLRRACSSFCCFQSVFPEESPLSEEEAFPLSPDQGREAAFTGPEAAKAAA